MLNHAALLFIFFYTLAMVSLWVPWRQRLVSMCSWGLFAAALSVALIEGWLQPVGLAWVVTLVAVTYLFEQTVSGWRKWLSLGGVIALSLGLATHLLPGFSVIPLAEAEHYRNLDKACVAYVLLALLAPRIVDFSELRAAVAAGWPFFVAAPLVIFPLAALSGLIENSPFAVPQHLWFWAWGNLLVTCVAEEVFFRGLLQRYLVQRWRAKSWGWIVALLLVALLFGLAHLGGGWAFMWLATLAGLFYGMAYHVSGRIEIAILLHFFINLLYLILRGA